jgi:hypothetical protein
VKDEGKKERRKVSGDFSNRRRFFSFPYSTRSETKESNSGNREGGECNATVLHINGNS